MSQPTPVLLLAFHFPPANESGAARPFRFYKYLPEFGYEPHVVTAARATMPRVYSVAAPTRVPDRKTTNGFFEAVLRKFAFPFDEAMLWSAAAYQRASECMREIRFGAMISTFPPVNTHLAGYALKRKYGLPWVADFRDPLYKPGIRGSMIDRSLDKRFLRAADLGIFVSDTVHAETIARHPWMCDKFRLLWNGYNPDEELGALEPPSGPQVLMHAGNLYFKRRPSAVLSSLTRIVRSGRIAPERVLLRLVGHMDPQIRVAEADSIEYLEKRGVLRVEPSMPRADALIEMRRAHSLLLMDMTEGNAGYTVPAKLFEYIRIGRPVLAFTGMGSPVARILEQSGIAHQVVNGDTPPEAIDTKVLSFFELSTTPREPHAAFVDEFDGRRQAGKLAKWLDELGARRAPCPAEISRC